VADESTDPTTLKSANRCANCGRDGHVVTACPLKQRVGRAVRAGDEIVRKGSGGFHRSEAEADGLYVGPAYPIVTVAELRAALDQLSRWRREGEARTGRCAHGVRLCDACPDCRTTLLSVSAPDPEADRAVHDRLSTRDTEKTE